MKNIFMLIVLFSVMLTGVHAASLFRWVDKDGKVHYGDKPAEDAVGVEQKRFSAPIPAGEDDLSYNMRKAKQNFPVILYVAPSCGELCVQAHAFLNKRGIPFTEKNLLTKQDVDAFIANTGADIVPAISIGKTQISGFKTEPWDAELDIAGYPKTAPYGTRPVPPAATPAETPAPAAK